MQPTTEQLAENSAAALQHPSEYLGKIIESFLRADKHRRKLVKLCPQRQVGLFERFFPNQETEQFAYVGSGSYAHVYRSSSSSSTTAATESEEEKENSNTKPSTTSSSQSKKISSQFSGAVVPAGTTILKLVDVYSETVLKNFNGTSNRSGVSTYKDAYNEFKVSTYLSYLNAGMDTGGKCGYLMCGTFPQVHQVYLATNSVPDYFVNAEKVEQLDYGKIFPKTGEEEEEDSSTRHCRSRPSVRDLLTTKPEVAIMKMEDCGLPMADIVGKLKPLEVLSLVKQILIGFMVAEKAFEFEHRDLHMGNIMVKHTEKDTLKYMYVDKNIYLPSYNLQVKIIDTTFSRLKFKRKVYYRNLSHLFNEGEIDVEKNKKNPLSHQNQTYRAMASVIQHDWPSSYPRSNLLWCIYIIKKFLHSRAIRKDKQKYASSVRKLLSAYVSILVNMQTMHEFFSFIYQKPELNRYVPIKMEAIQFNG